MKTVAAVATIFGMVGAVAAQTCCPDVYIVQAKFENSGTHMRRRLQDDNHPGLQGIPPEDTAVCKANRDAALGAQFDAQPTTGGPYWMLKGGDTLVEPVFTRAILDLTKEASYWKQDDGSGGQSDIVGTKRVVVIHTEQAPNFDGDWETPPTSAAPGNCDDPSTQQCPTCADPAPASGDAAVWTSDAIKNQLAGEDPYIIILSDSGNTADWETIFTQSAVDPPTGGKGDCGTTAGACKIYVATATSDVMADVLGVLSTVDVPTFGSCQVCSDDTTTTTTAGPTTTTAAGGNPPATTAPATTTTADGNSAGRLVAGMVPVATAALLALVM